jgi:hypothetical protein
MLEVTMMIGGLFGRTNGIAPGYEVTLDFEKFELYSEGEYVFDVNEKSGDFFYNWSQFTFAPVNWFSVGLVIQRTKAYKSNLDIEPGVLVEYSYKNVSFTAYVLDLGENSYATAFSVDWSF